MRQHCNAPARLQKLEPKAQKPQSLDLEQAFGHEPPQSIPVSVPF